MADKKDTQLKKPDGAKHREPDGPPGGPMAEVDVMDKDLSQYLHIRTKLDNNDEAVLKFLEARDAFGKARDEAFAAKERALVSPEHAAAKEMTDKLKPDLGFTDRTGKEINAPAIPATFAPHYLPVDAWAVDIKTDHKNAEDLTAAEWNKVLRINKALYGFTIREAPEMDVVNARYPAFLMRRADSSKLHLPALGNTPKTTPSNPELYFPEFEVVDASSISIIEIKAGLQSSLAHNGFSSRTVEASASGGAFGIQAGISTGLSTQNTTGVGSTDKNDEMEYFASYNFPRARVFMDELNLEVSPQCDEALKSLRDMADKPLEPLKESQDDRNGKAKDALRLFQEHFGHVFATQFCLGGQLQSTKSAKASIFATEEDKTDAFKMAVAASFSCPFASASAKYSNETQVHVNKKGQQSSELSKLAWTARGGDTRLCANPPAWAATLGNHSNWRVLQQECVVPLHELIGKVKGFEDMPEKLERIARRQLSNSQVKPSNRPWRNRIRLEPAWDRSKKLAYDRTHPDAPVVALDDKNKPEECVFTVLNADINEKNPDTSALYLPALYEQFPLFLTANKPHSRDYRCGNQVPGVWVNEAGELQPEALTEQSPTANKPHPPPEEVMGPPPTVMRWSFRKSLEMGPWQSKSPRTEIQDGDDVYLFCHSMMLGLFRDPDAPPRVGSPVCRSANFPAQIRAFSPSRSWSWAATYEKGDSDPVSVTDWLVLLSKLAGNAVAAEAQVMAARAIEVGMWRGAFDKEAEYEAAAKKDGENEGNVPWPVWFDTVGLKYSGSGHYAAFNPQRGCAPEGIRITSDMLARMDKDGFQPARFTVHFVE